jgi:hypothetical protein
MSANGNGGCQSRNSSFLTKAIDCFLANLPLVILASVMAVALLHELLA